MRSPSSNGDSPQKAERTSSASRLPLRGPFVSAGGLTVVHDGVCEYELVDVDGAPEGAPAGMLGVDRAAVDWNAFPPRDGLSAVSGRSAHAGRRAADDRPACRASLCARREARRPVRVGRRPVRRPPRGRLLARRGNVSRLGDGARHRGSSGERCARGGRGCSKCAAPSTPPPRPTTVATPGRLGGSSIFVAIPRAHPFEGSFELRPYGIATARLHAG